LTRAPLHLLTEPPVQLGRAAAASLLRRQRGIEQRQQQRTAEPACALVHRRFITLQKQVGRADLARTRRHYRRAKREIPAPLTVGSRIRDEKSRPALAATLQEAERATSQAFGIAHVLR